MFFHNLFVDPLLLLKRTCLGELEAELQEETKVALEARGIGKRVSSATSAARKFQ